MLDWWERHALLRPETMYFGVKILSSNRIVRQNLLICWIGGVIWTIGYLLELYLVKLRPELFFYAFFLNYIVTCLGVMLAICLCRAGIGSYVPDETVRLYIGATGKIGIWKPVFLLLVCSLFWYFMKQPWEVAWLTLVELWILAELMVGPAYQFAVAAGVKKALALRNEAKT